MPYNSDDPRTLTQLQGLQQAYPEWRVPTSIKKAPGITGFSPEELDQMGRSAPLPAGGNYAGGGLGGDQDADVALSILAQSAPSMGMAANPNAPHPVTFDDPLASQRVQTDADEAAQHQAIMAGFTGAKPKEVPAAAPSAEPGVSQLRKFIGGAPSPTQQAGQAAAALEQAKVEMPLLAEQEKGKQERLTRQAELEGFLKLIGKSPAGQPTPGQPDTSTLPDFLKPRPSHQTAAIPGAQPSPTPTAAQGPSPRLSWWSILSGQGAPEGSSAQDWTAARSERLKYDAGFYTPLAEAAQKLSFANLEQIQAMFPGVRGVAQLRDAFHEHQANWGHETPVATLQRLDGMVGMIHDLKTSLDDPSERFKLVGGRIQMTADPQAIARSKLLADDTLQKLVEARSILVRELPGLQQSLQQLQGHPPQPTTTQPSNWERVE